MLVIGAQFFPSTGGAEARQARARAALRALPHAYPVNLQFADDPHDFAGLTTVPVLRMDSRRVTGGEGRRKPIVSEMFDALADVACRERATWFAYVNADIEVAAAAVEAVLSSSRDALAFSRIDIDPVTRAPIEAVIYGIDLFAIRVEWWRRERRRFRPYIAGEPGWDNVYAAILCCRGSGTIVSDSSGVLHERHESGWGDSVFAAYNGYLATLDAPYFSRWATYVAGLENALARGGPIDRERIAATAFSAPVRWSPRHAVRQARAHLRFARRRFSAR